MAQWRSSFFTFNAWPNGAAPSSHSTLGPMAQLLPHIQRLAQWRSSFLTFNAWPNGAAPSSHSTLGPMAHLLPHIQCLAQWRSSFLTFNAWPNGAPPSSHATLGPMAHLLPHIQRLAQWRSSFLTFNDWPNAQLLPHIQRLAQWHSSFLTFNAWPNGAPPSSHSTLGPMAQLLPHIQRLAQWRSSFLTFNAWPNGAAPSSHSTLGPMAQLLPHIQRLAQWRSSFLTFNAWPNGAAPSSHATLGPMAQLLPHIQRLAQWRTSFLTFMMYVFIPRLFKWTLSLSKHWCMFILSPLGLNMCIFVVVSAKRRSSVLQRTRCSSKCTLFVPRRITSPITTCLTLGRAAKRHAIRCRSAATTDPSQCAEQRSFIPASSTTTVGRQNGHCVNHIYRQYKHTFTYMHICAQICCKRHFFRYSANKKIWHLEALRRAVIFDVDFVINVVKTVTA